MQVYHAHSIGGVGSYLLNLSAALVRHGHRVLLAAPPGPLAGQFSQAGVQFMPTCISDWRPLRSCRLLSNLIRAEGVDLVNAHDYSAGAAAYLATRRTDTPYVLTIHCHRPFWQRLVVFYWSSKVIAVSPVLREHLINQMRLSPERVVESFVGVDIERFQPGPVPSSLYGELGLAPGEPIVLHASRLSATKSAVALALTTAAVDLIRAHPRLKLFFAGTGEDEQRVRIAADRANGLVGRQAVRVLGARRDVADLMRAATVVVGAGTVGLEALATGCPLVAAGKLGFGGLVTPENFTALSESLFGDHGFLAAPPGENYATAIDRVLCDARNRAALSAWGRDVIVSKYGVDRMAAHVAATYDQLGKSPSDHARIPSLEAVG